MKSLESFFNTSVIRMKKDNQLILLFSFIIGIVNSIYYVFFPISFHKTNIYQGPILSLFERLHGGWNYPILIFLSFFFIVISIILLKNIFAIKRKSSIVLLTILVFLFPVFSENMLFQSSYLGVIISFFFAVLSLFYLHKKKTVLNILFMILSFCIYPFSITIPISGIFLLSIHGILHQDFHFKKIAYCFFSVIMGVLLSQVFFQLFSFIVPNDFAISIHSLSHIFQYEYNFFFKNSILFKNIIHILVFLGLIIFFIRRVFLWNHRFAFIISVFLLFLSSGISFVFSNQLETSIGFLMIYLFLIVIMESKDMFPFYKTFQYISLLILCFTYLLSNQSSFMVQRDEYLALYAKHQFILQKAKSLEGYQSNLTYLFSDPIYYYSSLNSLSNRDYSLDLLSTKFYKEFYKKYLGEVISFPSSSLKKEILSSDEYLKMKVGDIQIIHNVIVVKTSNSCYYQKY